jgi:hypothetical protein
VKGWGEREEERGIVVFAIVVVVVVVVVSTYTSPRHPSSHYMPLGSAALFAK